MRTEGAGRPPSENEGVVSMRDVAKQMATMGEAA